MGNYHPFESDGLNLVRLIREIGDDPSAAGTAPFNANVVRCLWGLLNKLQRDDDQWGSPVLVNVSTSYLARDNDLIVIDGLASDIVITLPASGSIYIKRMDDSNYTVTVHGTIDGETGVILDYRDGMHLVGSNNQFFFV